MVSVLGARICEHRRFPLESPAMVGGLLPLRLGHHCQPDTAFAMKQVVDWQMKLPSSDLHHLTTYFRSAKHHHESFCTPSVFHRMPGQPLFECSSGFVVDYLGSAGFLTQLAIDWTA